MGGGVGGPELAAAVQRSGGLGMVSFGEEVPDGSCGVNFLVPFLPRIEQISGVARRARVVEFFYGTPSPELVEVGHDARAVVGWQVGSAEEAEAAENAGCDYVIAQGTEAGGHVRGELALDALLPDVLARTTVPVLASGGIATADRVAELIAVGADGVRAGTCFLCTAESQAHDAYKQNLLSASGQQTVVTDWFGEGWPGAPHRVLRPALDVARRTGWRDPRPPSRGERRDVEDMAQYAGAGVGHVTSVRPASEVVQDLVRLL